MRDRLRAARDPLIVAGLATLATGYVALVDPHQAGRYPVCPLYLLTGTYCAGCGGLRATNDLLHGDLAGAWGMNPLWVLVAPVLVVLLGVWLVRRWRSAGTAATSGVGTSPQPPGPGSPPTTGRAVPWQPIAVLAVLLVYSVLRNVPALAPWLAP
ncbi:DUF2752 domain-containing protein [Cellulomonas hominis]